MTRSSLLLFALVYFAAVATPGPGVAALVARVLGHGLKGIAPFVAGYVAGDMIWLTIAATGLSVIARNFAGLFVALKFMGAAYLLSVAFRMATSASAAGGRPPASSRAWRAFLGSLSLTLGNPKVMIFFLSVMPLVVDMRALTPVALAELCAAGAVVMSLTLGAYALAANRARAFLSSTRAMRLVHRAAGALMAGVAVAVAAS